MVALAKSRAATLDLSWLSDSSRIRASTTPLSASRRSRLTCASQRSTWASYFSSIAVASLRLAAAALTSAPATPTTSWARAIRSLSSPTVAPLVRWSSTSSGTNSVASTSSFFTLSPMSTFHFSMNAAGLAKIDVRSYASMKLG